MNAYYVWLEENVSTDDLIPGAFYNDANGQWVIYDYEAVSEFIKDN